MSFQVSIYFCPSICFSFNQNIRVIFCHFFSINWFLHLHIYLSVFFRRKSYVCHRLQKLFILFEPKKPIVIHIYILLFFTFQDLLAEIKLKHFLLVNFFLFSIMNHEEYQQAGKIAFRFHIKGFLFMDKRPLPD